MVIFVLCAAGYIGKRHVLAAIREVESEIAANRTSGGDSSYRNVKFVLCRVPFFLEPGYHEGACGAGGCASSADGVDHSFRELHDTRMLRKFGSMAAFERFKRSHGLVPRGNEVGLNADMGYTEENLARRVQSSTLRSHRLIAYLSQVSGLFYSDSCLFVCLFVCWSAQASMYLRTFSMRG
jgi:hypothetical protein